VNPDSQHLISAEPPEIVQTILLKEKTK